MFRTMPSPVSELIAMVLTSNVRCDVVFLHLEPTTPSLEFKNIKMVGK